MAKKNNIIKKITKATKKNPGAAIGISAAGGGIAALAGEFIWRRTAKKALAAKKAAFQMKKAQQENNNVGA